MKIIVTGSNGFIGARLVTLLREQFSVIGIDRLSGPEVDIMADISDPIILDWLDVDDDFIIIHCAAARTDYGLSPAEYLEDNVNATRKFLVLLRKLKVRQFLHISSVASFDGEKLEYSKNLNNDDAYRVTKHAQELEVYEWCRNQRIPLDILMPSAIYEQDPRSDTNIGKLQRLVHFLPILPRINVFKSLTYLPHFLQFIESLVNSPTGRRYLTIELPVQRVTEIMLNNLQKRVKVIPIPGLMYYLLIFSYINVVFFALRNSDPKLTPQRVRKLYRDTSYSTVCSGVDIETYARRFS